MVPDGQLQGEPTSPMHRLQLGESTFQGREAFDDRSIALDAGGISVMHRFDHNPGGVMNVVHGSAANRSWRLRRQEAEGLPPRVVFFVHLLHSDLARFDGFGFW
jgi:hypothetical protein